MKSTAKVSLSAVATPMRALGPAKFLRDIFSILGMKIYLLRQSWQWYLMGSLVFPVSMFYWSRALAPDDPEAVRRLLTGSIVFGVAIMTASSLSDQLVQDRFQGRLKLLITMPMSKFAYAIGVLIFASFQSAMIIAVLLTFGFIAGVELSLSLAFFPIVLATMLIMSGLTLFLASIAPNAEVGGIINNLVGILPVMISPVFFTMEQAPLLLRWLGWVSPFRYSADGIAKTLSGNQDIWMEFAILVGYATVTMAIGFWKLRWRER